MDILIEKINLNCPFCNKEHKLEKRKRTTKGLIKNEQVIYDEEYYMCKEILEEENEFVTAKIMDQNLLNARDSYRQMHKLLTSKQIKEIREKYKLTQSEFSYLLGLGEITITRYESKLIQTEAYDKLIKLIGENALLALEYLRKSKEKFTNDRYKEIENNIIEIININTYNYLNIQEIHAKYVEYEDKNIYNGFKKLDIDKIQSVLQYVASKITDLYKVKLMKILWYIDFLYFKEYKKSMMGLVYSHQKMGALPIGFDEIIKLSSITVDEQIKQYDGEYKSCYHILPNKNYKTKGLIKDEMDIINKVLDKFLKFKTSEIVEYMHKEKAYQETKPNQIIDYSMAKYISI